MLQGNQLHTLNTMVKEREDDILEASSNFSSTVTTSNTDCGSIIYKIIQENDFFSEAEMVGCIPCDMNNTPNLEW